MINFNGAADTAISGLYVKNIKRPVMPDIINIIGGGPGVTGQYDFGGTFGSRPPISVIFGASAASQQALQTLFSNFAAWLSPLTVKPLTFDDEPGKIYYARVINAGDIDQILKYGEVEIKFYCPDPFKYSNALKTVNFVSNAAATTNNGNQDTPPAFTVTFTAAASEIKIILGSKFVRVVKNFIIGDVLTIDNKTGAILLNGVRAINYYDWQSSQFFKLAPGSNNLMATPTNVAAISMTYTERWL